jgi:hypothetical protein
MGSPPPKGSKNEVLKFRSINSIVIAPAKTGRLRSNKTAVIRRDHKTIFIRSNFIAEERIFIIVVIKLIDPRILLTPAM